MANTYDSKLTDGKALALALGAVKTRLDAKQAQNDLLTSLSGITETSGILTLSASKTVVARPLADTDVASGSALEYAVDAFGGKDGSIKVPAGKGVVDANSGENIVNNSASGVVIGVDNSTAYIGSVDDANALMKKSEITELIEDMVTESSDYRSTHELFSIGATVAGVKTLIEGATLNNTTPGITAIVHGEDEPLDVYVGTYNGTAWAWELLDPAPTNGNWFYFVEQITDDNYDTTAVRHAGRAIFTKNAGPDGCFDVIPEKNMQPDDVAITLDTSGRLTIKTTSITTEAGTVTVPASFNAATLAYDATHTIKEKIDGLKLDGDTVMVADPAGEEGDEITLQTALDEINETLDGKINVIASPTVGAVPSIDADGMLANSSVLLADVLTTANIITAEEMAELITDVFGD